MGSHSYNNPNAQLNSSMSVPYSQGSNGSSYPPPGYFPSPAHGPSQRGPPPPDDGTRRGYPPPASGYLQSPAHGPSQSGPPLPDDGTGRGYPPPGYLPFPAHAPSQSGPPPPDNGTGRGYPPKYPGPSQGRPPPHDPDPSQTRPSSPGPGPSQTRPPPDNGTRRGSGLISSSRHSVLSSSRGLSGWLSSSLSVIQYILGQQVHVNISANRWVVGVIVGFVYLTEKITGSKYRVDFEGGQTGAFLHEQMKPYQPGG